MNVELMRLRGFIDQLKAEGNSWAETLEPYADAWARDTQASAPQVGEPPPLPAGEVMASGVVGGVPVSLVRYTEADIRNRDGWWQQQVRKAATQAQPATRATDFMDGVFNALHPASDVTGSVFERIEKLVAEHNDRTSQPATHAEVLARLADEPIAAQASALPAAQQPAADAVARIVHLRADRERRIYIAGPMTGLPEYNFPAFNAAAERLRADGWHVENPAEHGHIAGAEWADYLRWDLSRVVTVAAVYLLPGWPKSKGASLEVTVARALGLALICAPGAEDPAAHPAAQQPAAPSPYAADAASRLRMPMAIATLMDHAAGIAWGGANAPEWWERDFCALFGQLIPAQQPVSPSEREQYDRIINEAWMALPQEVRKRYAGDATEYHPLIAACKAIATMAALKGL